MKKLIEDWIMFIVLILLFLYRCHKSDIDTRVRLEMGSDKKKGMEISDVIQGENQMGDVMGNQEGELISITHQQG